MVGAARIVLPAVSVQVRQRRVQVLHYGHILAKVNPGAAAATMPAGAVSDSLGVGPAPGVSEAALYAKW